MIRRILGHLKKAASKFMPGKKKAAAHPAAAHPAPARAHAAAPRKDAAHAKPHAATKHAAHPKPHEAKAAAHPKTAPAGEGATRGPRAPRPDRPPRRDRRGDRRPAPSDEAPETQAWRPKPPPGPPWDPAAFQVPPEDGKTRFHDLALPPEILHAVADLGFRYCTPIQAGSLPPALSGRDVAGRAQTGTGKTAAFLITIIAHCMRNPMSKRRPGSPRALILAPTRELAVQIENDAIGLARHSGVGVLAIYGGAEYDRQKRALNRGNPEIIVATPGRLLDFRGRFDLDLGQVEILVIDEADRMLDMGFIPDVRQIVFATPPKERRQTMLFSATLDEPVLKLASSWLKDPVRVDIEPENVAVDTVEQKVFIVTSAEKFPLLLHLLKSEGGERVVLFVNRRTTGERVHHFLRKAGFNAALISGALTQAQRMRTLEQFRAAEVQVLVATDVASRGLHIEGVSHVINYNIPLDPEDYVHRIGRTGRAGAQGTSITFACEDESFYLPDIEKYLGRPLVYLHPTDEQVAAAGEWEPIPDTPAERDGDHRFRPGGRGGPRGGGRGGPRRGGPPARGGGRRR